MPGKQRMASKETEDQAKEACGALFDGRVAVKRGLGASASQRQTKNGQGVEEVVGGKLNEKRFDKIIDRRCCSCGLRKRRFADDDGDHHVWPAKSVDDVVKAQHKHTQTTRPNRD